jgi:F-type H+-transporting ATPase subunit delta
MKGNKSASRYATALLDLAIEQNQVDQVFGDMTAFLAAVEETRELQLFLNSPVVNSAKKKEVLHAAFGNFCPLSISFIQLITTNSREGALTEIAKSFIQQYKTHKGIVEVTLTTATKPDASVKEQILNKIKSSVRGTIELTEIINPDLIGGFVLQMGDTRIDASVSNQFRNLKQRLTK